jgi:hypothetical protein
MYIHLHLGLESAQRGHITTPNWVSAHDAPHAQHESLTTWADDRTTHSALRHTSKGSRLLELATTNLVLFLSITTFVVYKNVAI